MSSLKGPVLQQLAEDKGGTRLCGALAHLYHYYLHGARGRAKGENGNTTTNNESSSKTTAASNPLPEIVVRGIVAGKPAWECRLADVRHDLESRSLAATASEFEFVLQVPGKASAGPEGVVAGVLRYFPFEGERETVPDAVADADAAAAAAVAAAAGSKQQRSKQKKRPASGGSGGGRDLPQQQLRRRSSGSDIAGGAIDMTQVGSGALTQRLQQQQKLTQAGAGVSAIHEGDEEAAAVADAEALALAAAADLEEAADPINDNNDGDDDDAVVAAAANAAALARLRGPCLEAFWQGRLIPGARVESLPFVDAVRARARAAGGAARDAVPDEVFGRLRGALFFGPAWLVTRNKLTFRDDLRGLLAAATGESCGSSGGGGGGGVTTTAAANSGASLERRFREWLARCHATLDKRVRYESPAPPRLQASAREAHGEAITVFERASEGGSVAVAGAPPSSASSPPDSSTSYAAGDLVRLAVKPAIIGKVLYFHVPVAGASAGAHGGGFVTVAPLPEKLWGGVTRTFPFRRLASSSSSNGDEGGEAAAATSHVSEEEAAAHVARELSRAPSAARLVEPLRMAAGGNGAMSLAAGATLPETGVAALAGGSLVSSSAAAAAANASRVTRAMLGGRRVPLVMVQRLWFLGGGNGGGEGVGEEAEAMEGDDAEADAPAAAAAAAASKKSLRGARKGKGAAAAAAEEEEGEEEAAAAHAAAAATAPPPAASSSRALVLEVENRTPSRDGLFRFSKVSDGLKRAGRYELEYELLPRLPGGEGGDSSSRITACVTIDVAPGAAATVEASGPGRAAASAAPLPLGAPLPALELVYRDEFGNAARPPGKAAGGFLKGVSLSVVRSSSGGNGAESDEVIGDLRALSTAVDATASGATLSRVRVVGAEGVTGGVSIFSSPSSVEGEGEGDDDEEPRGAQRANGAGSGASALLRAPAVVSLLVSAPLSSASSSSSSSKTSASAVSVSLPLRLLPGAPVALRISGKEGGDASSSSAITSLLAAGVPAGSPLPAFSVQALDAWGNLTAPFEGVFGFELEVASSPLLELPAEGKRFCFDGTGTARVEGLTAAAAAADASSFLTCSPPLFLSLVVKPLCPAAADAVDAAGTATPLSLPMRVQPSRAPARLQLLLDGRPLPMLEEGGAAAGAAARNNDSVENVEGADNKSNGDDAPSALLAGVPAGASVSGLSLRVLDAGGCPCDPSLPGSGLDGEASTGKLQVSWMRGHKKVKASDMAAGGGGGTETGENNGGLITLPPLEAPERVGEAASFWVRLKFSGRGAPLLEAGLTVSCSPGAPRSWQLRLVDGGKSGNGNADVEGDAVAANAAANNKKSSSSSEGDVFAGVPFVLEVEALDEFANRCPFDAAAVPIPKLSVARLPGGNGSGGGGGGNGRGGRSSKSNKNNDNNASASEAAAAPWLECDPSVWDGTWNPISSSAGAAGEPLGDVFVARGVVRGSTGRLLLEVRDDGDGRNANDDECSSTLSPDALELTLGPGPPATLAFDPLPAPFASSIKGAAASANAAGGASSSSSSRGAAPAPPAALGLALALPPLTVRVLDACGNAVTSGPSANGTDVALLPGALATDGTGRAAAVSAAAVASSNGGAVVAGASSSSSSGGAIKARLADGVATFENVRVSAAVPNAGGGSSKPQKKGGAASAAAAAAAASGDPFSLARAAAAAAAVSGCYALRAKPASRSLAAAFGEIEVFLAPSNAVVRVSIRGMVVALPDNGGGGAGVEQLQQAKGGRGKASAPPPSASASSSSATLVAGSTATFIVDIATEDGVPLPAEVAAAGLRLCLIEQSGGGGGGGAGVGVGVGGNDNVPSTPVALDASAPAPLAGEPGAFAISSAEPILRSGRYAVSAEWSEPREEVAAAARWRAPTAAGSNNGGSSYSMTLLRSTSVELVVSAGPAVSLVLDPAPGAAHQRQQSGSKRRGGVGASDPAAPPSSLTASNGGGEAARSVIPRPVALQLVDLHGNPVAREGVKVRLALVLAGADPNAAAAAAAAGGGRSGRGKRAAAATATSSSSAVPLLEGAAAEEHETDERGRAFIGPVRIAEGTGGGGSGGEAAARSLDLRLVALFLMTAAAEGGSSDSASPFVEALSLPLLFTDGGALAETIAAAASERDAAAAARDELEAKVAEARAAAVAAERDAAAAARAVAAARRAVGGGRSSAPDSPGAAKTALEAARQRRAEEASAAPQRGGKQRGGKQQRRGEKQHLLQQLDLAASHGPAGKPMTKSVDACLSDGGGNGGAAAAASIPGVVGVFARLATVDDARLSAVLAAQYRGLLPVVVVRDPQARALLAAARSGDSLPTPDIVALTHVQPFRAAGPVPEDSKSRSILLPHRSKSASSLARTLVAAACQGSDAPLPFPLPHAKVLLAHGARKRQAQQQQQGGRAAPSPSNALVAAAPPKGVPAADEWPEGCLGYAFNLVRPTKKGARAALLYPLLGQTLVFESLETGSAYREHLATRLRAGCGDIVSLDGGRVSSKGVTSGSGFAVPPAGSVPWRFGSTPANQRPRIQEEEEEEEAEEEEEEEAERDGADNADPAALEALVAALEARAGADAKLRDARERSSRVEGRLLPQIEAASRAVEEAEARMQELRKGSGNGGNGDEEEEEEQEENGNDENEAPAAARGGGSKRRAPLQLEASKTPQASKANKNNNKRMRKMVG